MGVIFPTGRTKSASGAQFAALSLVKPVVDLRARAKSHSMEKIFPPSFPNARGSMCCS